MHKVDPKAWYQQLHHSQPNLTEGVAEHLQRHDAERFVSGAQVWKKEWARIVADCRAELQRKAGLAKLADRVWQPDAEAPEGGRWLAAPERRSTFTAATI